MGTGQQGLGLRGLPEKVLTGQDRALAVQIKADASFRVLGTIGACRLVDPATGLAHDSEDRFGWKLHRRALDHGLLVRPIGDCLYLMPPLATSPERVREAVRTLATLLS